MRTERERLENSLTDFLIEAWPWIDPAPYVHNWHIEAIADHLEAVTWGRIKRLGINVPPRSAKSSLISVAYPAWVWAQTRIAPLSGPQVQFMFASYNQTLAEKLSVATLRLIQSPWYQKRWGERFKLLSENMRKFENDKGGYRLATSAGGLATGEGGIIIVCLPYKELVLSSIGWLPIGEIVERRLPVLIAGLDHESGERVWQQIDEYETNPGRPLVCVRFGGGSLRCTADHPIWTAERGYVRAGEVRAGETIWTVSREFLPPMRGMDQAQTVKISQNLQHDMSRCFAEKAGARAQQQAVFGVRQEGLSAPSPSCADAERAILQPCVPRDWSNGSGKRLIQNRKGAEFLRSVWRCFRGKALRTATVLLSVLRKPLSVGALAKAPERGPMPALRESLQAPLRWATILLNGLQEFSPCPAGQRSWQWALCAWGGRAPVPARLDPQLSRRNPPKRWKPMSMVPSRLASGAADVSCPSYRLCEGKPRAGQSGDLVSSLPRHDARHKGPPRGLESHVVRSVAPAGYAERTYNLRVSRCSNFFAAGVLVHNCDDPLNAEDANSQTERDNVIRWWDETMPTRLNDPINGAKIVQAQRLHEDDLCGHIIAQSSEEWDWLVIPMRWDEAYADSRTTSLGWHDPRTIPGELMCEERWPEDVLEKLEAILGPYAASAQLQQTPTPRGGGIIKSDWWQLYEEDSAKRECGVAPTTHGVLAYPPLSYILVSVDTAYKESEENDYNACSVWGVWHNAKGWPRVILMEAWRWRGPLVGERLEGQARIEAEAESRRPGDFPPHWGLTERVLDTARRRRADMILIEDKTRGVDLRREVYRLLQPGELSVRLEPTTRDKVSRLHATVPLFADKMVWAPDKAWAQMMIDEVSQVPKGRHDDLADTCSMGLIYLRANHLVRLGTESDEDEAERARFRPQVEAPYDV